MHVVQYVNNARSRCREFQHCNANENENENENENKRERRDGYCYQYASWSGCETIGANLGETEIVRVTRKSKCESNKKQDCESRKLYCTSTVVDDYYQHYNNYILQATTVVYGAAAPRRRRDDAKSCSAYANVCGRWVWYVGTSTTTSTCTYTEYLGAVRNSFALVRVCK